MPATQLHFTKMNRSSVTQKLGGLDWKEFADEVDRIPVGEDGYITIHRKGKPKSPEELGYYYGKILPEAFKAFKANGQTTVDFPIESIKGPKRVVRLPLTIETTDTTLKSIYGGWKGDYKDKGDMNMAECAAFMDWCILWLAEHYNCHIPEADPNWKEKR